MTASHPPPILPQLEEVDASPTYARSTYDMFMNSQGAELSEITRFDAWVRSAKAADAWAFEVPREGAQRPEVRLARDPSVSVLNFSAYNYLGYGYHPQVIAAAKQALDQYGLGAASSPVLSGTFALHRELEDALAAFTGLPDWSASLFSSGYGVNTGTISAIVKAGHAVVLDRSVHMSILEGAQLSGAEIAYFRHNDPAHLDRVLRRLGAAGLRTLVCMEGVYSADGDYGRLAELVAVAKRYGAMTLVDEAHSILVAGPTGRGVCEAAGVLGEVDMQVITFSKGFGGVGGALLARREITRYVNWYARCRMFSCAIAPAVTGGVLAALRLGAGPDGAARRTRLWANAARLRERLRERVDTGPSESWIIPVMFGDEQLTLPVAAWLQQHGLDVGVMQFPAVAKSEARLRLFVTSEHQEQQIDRAAELVVAAAEHFGFTKAGAR